MTIVTGASPRIRRVRALCYCMPMTHSFRTRLLLAGLSLFALAGCKAIAPAPEDVAPPPASSSSEAPVVPALDTSGWQTYANDVYRYQIKIPKDAVIVEAKKDMLTVPEDERAAGKTIDDVFAEVTGKVCIAVRTELAIVYISAPVNVQARYSPCGRTGVGYPIEEKNEPITVEGEKHIAYGYEAKGPGELLTMHSEWFSLSLPDGTKISYGSAPNDQATYADYLAKKAELRAIVESYRGE
ncbi:TPA: hypothetical protein DCL30_05370 [Candidatus Peribacteria bacterium]|nr:hypothetical protein [Candidatus Peribacteria bacterium]